MAETSEPRLVDSVVLIDGDNDPHLPADFVLTDKTLVRVFLRPAAKIPRSLDKRVGHLPYCLAVVSPKSGANAADFVMSLHAGMLHAILPMHIPFTMVTRDKSLAAMAQELQRIGRIATLWTSHDETDKRPAAGSPRTAQRRSPSSASRGRRGGRSRSGSRRRSSPASPASTPATEPLLEAPTPPVAATAAPTPAAPGSRSIASVAAGYASRLSRIKDIPSRAKALLNDIKNRTVSSGYTPEEILEELKRSHGVVIDDQGRVHRNL